MFNGILPSNYFCKGWNPPPPLTTMLNGISCCQVVFATDQIRYPLRPPCSVGCYLQLISMVDQVRHPLWQPILNGILPSTYLHERSNPPPPSDDYVQWDSTFSFIFIRAQIRHPALTTMLIGILWYYIKFILIRNQIRHLLWQLYWMGNYVQLIFMRDQIRHPLWRLCWLGYYPSIAFNWFSWGIKSATPSDNYVEWVEKDFAACSSGHCIA